MVSTQIIIIEKNGTVKEQKIKWTGEDDLYKKAGTKSASGFRLLGQWKVKVKGTSYELEVYGKKEGRAGQENKYDFPPPIDKDLLFGNCVIINKKDGEINSLSTSQWESIYEHLFGGFEDLGAEDSEESEEEDPGLPRTKSGYYKDGFVVDDGSGESEDSDYKPLVKKTKKTKINTSGAGKQKKKKEPVNAIVSSSEFEELLNSTDELCEEEYL
jgi:hypothetical protein